MKKIPQCLSLSVVNETLKSVHPHSKTTFLRFSPEGNYVFDLEKEINLANVCEDRSKKILEYNK